MSKTEKETYEFNGKKLPVKELQVEREAVDLLIWIETQRKARQLEMEMWSEQASHVRRQVAESLGLDLEETKIDWERLLTDGKLRYVDLSKAKGEKKEKDENPEL